MPEILCGTENNFKFCPFCCNKLTIAQVDDHYRPVCDKCGWIHYLNPPPVVCVLCYRKNPQRDLEVLLIKRAVEPKKGHWSLPGGFMEIGESPQQASLRELREETGIDGLACFYLVSAEYQQSRRYGSVVVIGYAGELSGDIKPIAGDDAEQVAWFTISQRPKMPFHSFETIFCKWQKRLKEQF